MTKTKKEGVLTIYNELEELIGIVAMDMTSRKRVLYRCTEMDEDEIASLLGANTSVEKKI